VRVSQGEAVVEQRKISSIHFKHKNKIMGVYSLIFMYKYKLCNEWY